MPIVTISNRDMLRSTIVEPAWYRVRVESIGEKLAKSGKSTNYPIEGTILFNGDNGDTKYAGVPTPAIWMFNSEAIGQAIGFLVACGQDEAELKEAIKTGKGRFELGDGAGKDIDVFIANGTWEGNTQNQIKHQYRKPNPNIVAKE